MNWLRRTVAALCLGAAAAMCMILVAAPAHASPTTAADRSAVEMAGSASAPSAPSARASLCFNGPCLLFDRSETATIATGSPAAAIALIAANCDFIPPPGNIICAGGAAIYGPVTQQVALSAQRNGFCLGIGNGIGGPVPLPTQGICRR